MSFGRNPHVLKAQAAELKAQEAGDKGSRERAWREAAHLWERALKLEENAKKRVQYQASADGARTEAENAAKEEKPALDAVVLPFRALQPTPFRS